MSLLLSNNKQKDHNDKQSCQNPVNMKMPSCLIQKKIRCIVTNWLQKLSENHVTQFVNLSFKFLTSLVDLERITIQINPGNHNSTHRCFNITIILEFNLKFNNYKDILWLSDNIVVFN